MQITRQHGLDAGCYLIRATKVLTQANAGDPFWGLNDYSVNFHWVVDELWVLYPEVPMQALNTKTLPVAGDVGQLSPINQDRGFQIFRYCQ